MRGVGVFFLLLRVLQLVCFFGLVFMYAHSQRIANAQPHLTHSLCMHTQPHLTHSLSITHTAHAEPHTKPHRATHSHTKSRTQGRGHINLIIKVPILVKTKENHTVYTHSLRRVISKYLSEYLHTYTTSPPQETPSLIL